MTPQTLEHTTDLQICTNVRSQSPGMAPKKKHGGEILGFLQRPPAEEEEDKVRENQTG